MHNARHTPIVIAIIRLINLWIAGATYAYLISALQFSMYAMYLKHKGIRAKRKSIILNSYYPNYRILLKTDEILL